MWSGSQLCQINLFDSYQETGKNSAPIFLWKGDPLNNNYSSSLVKEYTWSVKGATDFEQIPECDEYVLYNSKWDSN
ncbi:hypothetical protein [Echinococcus multilocularis]|uniref:Uncharacterized protein n=1 Tax=Echinococcus multilocularis TaxID=6211 RepID=A0A068Y755_ECHMU|nr:hypothetical protein [Echinococcus multilocularis]